MRLHAMVLLGGVVTAACVEVDAGRPPGLTCDQHYVECLDTELGRPQPIATDCWYCREECKQRGGEWPNFTRSGRDCRYWLYRYDPIIVEAPDAGVR